MRNTADRVCLSVHPWFFILFTVAVYLVPLKWLFAWFLSTLIHESGHIIAVNLCGGSCQKIVIRGSGCTIHTTELPLISTIICAAAGPAAGIVICLFYKFIPRVAICAFVQSMFNLLPIYPLDGGRILRSVMSIGKTPCKPDSVAVQ